jgi:hypothetical protein
MRKGTRVTGAARDKLAADLRRKYEAGQSIRTIASASGRSYGFVHRILSETGATVRRQRVHAKVPAGGRGERGPAGPSAEAPATYDDLVRRGVIQPPRAGDGPRPLPRPTRARGGLSDIVLAQRE